jgi:hypothetical protein
MSSNSFKPQLFLLTRTEVLVLSWISVILILIGFTLGVHLGKQLGGPSEVSRSPKTSRIQTLEDQSPSRQDLIDQSKGAPSLVQEVLQKTLYEEVQRSGVKLKTPHTVDLPQNPVSQNAGATTLKNSK